MNLIVKLLPLQGKYLSALTPVHESAMMGSATFSAGKAESFRRSCKVGHAQGRGWRHFDLVVRQG